MDTDQAFDLLKAAEVPEEICIQTVRRWLKERKIIYSGKVRFVKTGYILEDTDQAIDLLKDAGVDAAKGIKAIQRWLYEGKIQKIGSRNQITEYIEDEKNTKLFLNKSSDQDKLIRDLKGRIKMQDEQLKELEELHKSTVTALNQQKEKLQKEIRKLETENGALQKETKRLLSDNIGLRKQLLKLQEELSKGGKRDAEITQRAPISATLDYQQKLGLSKTAGQKDILAAFKKLLKTTHPDHGGSPAVFHYVKTEYDHFKNSLKG
ncbi:hypothetical protein [Neobacillus fumarioli]|uniref:hypothetical protein n=1 Tax=Neobacillus fumarioli TaxID=105229 RepID=UPI000830DE01|nr:hypothetical protein [Neobacillus fumarioli]